jgi:hypothetical protein
LVGRLSELLVEALELGSGKHEPDELVAEIFRPFGIDFYELAAQYRRTRLRKEAADRLTKAAPSAEELINEVVRCGGRFIEMVQDVYRRLARHAVNAGGQETEKFRLQRAGVSEDQLVISEAFIEQVRSLQSKLRSIAIGSFRYAAIARFAGFDDGRFYGPWTAEGSDGEPQLADKVVSLARVMSAAREQVPAGPAGQFLVSAIEGAQESAERLVATAESLVRSHVAHLDLLAAVDEETAVQRLFSLDHGWMIEHATSELERFRSGRVLGELAGPNAVASLSEVSAIGLRAAEFSGELTPVTLPATPGWVWHTGQRARLLRRQVPPRPVSDVGRRRPHAVALWSARFRAVA